MKVIPDTTAYRVVNGAGHGQPGLYVDRLGSVILIQSETPPTPALVEQYVRQFPGCSVYYKALTPHVRGLRKEEASPRHIEGPVVDGRFSVLENGLTFLLSMASGYSYGLFLDQRDNRCRILEMDLRGKTVLNSFAYTCAFSVCAASAGATVTSIDLSKKYLEWGRGNFQANQLDDTAHDFIFGDVFDWLPRLIKKGRRWDMVILDPPTFSTGKSAHIFQAKRDYPKLITLARSCLTPQGVILACVNAADVDIRSFQKWTGVAQVLPPPPDFPTAPGMDPPFKSGWVHAERLS